ncbi:hypothetical protein [Reichenbachiella sp. MALMAid0571]|uniref:hypothetical protein n=1 Tax=Reichenbachiella sp. MALMAid0571 TaxID=3143939 RepID=UPI0032DFEFCF
MNSLKPKYLLVFFFIIPLASNAQAKEWMEKTPEERSEKLTSWMESELELTPDQKDQAYEVNLKYAQKGEELKNSSGRKVEKFRTIKEYGKAKDKELKEIFNTDQFDSYLNKKDELRKIMKEKKAD